MRNARRTLRSSMAWGMIPLALLAGLPATSCFCADGGFKLYCGGHLAFAQTSPGVNRGAQPSAAPRHCPACGAKGSVVRAGKDRALACAPASTERACCDDGQSPTDDSSPACCRLIESAPVTLTTEVSAPDFATSCQLCLVEIVSVPRLAATALARAYDAFETGPPVDRVIVHCSLLI